MNSHNFFIISTIDFSKKSAAATRMISYAKALAVNQNQIYLISSCSNKLSDPEFAELAPNIFLLDKKNITLNFLATFLFLRRLDKFSKSKGDTRTFVLYPTAFVFLELLTILYLKIYKQNLVFYELNEIRKYASSYEAPMSFNRFLYSLKKIIFKVLFTITQPLLSLYDGLICISTEIEKYGQQFNKNTLRIPILTDSNYDFKYSEKKYCTEGSYNVGFSGSIHPIKENLNGFIDIIEKLKATGYSVSFNLCGGIFKTYRAEFLRRCDSMQELNYYGFLNELEMSTFLIQQHLLVLPRGYTEQNRYGFSTKLSDYLNHKKMVLVTDVSDNSLYIKDGVNGFVVPPNNNDLMYEKLKYIIENFSSLEKVVIPNTIKTVQNEFDYKIFTPSLTNFLTERKSL